MGRLSRDLGSRCLLAAVLAGIVVLPHVVIGQAASDALPLSYRVFVPLQQIYEIGQAPALVDKLNKALELIGEADSSHLRGDDATAAILDEQAKTMMNEISSETPSAQEAVQREAASRTFFVVAIIPVAVVLSTLGFLVVLMVWRWYERMRLFEMRIVVGKKEED